MKGIILLLCLLSICSYHLFAQAIDPTTIRQVIQNYTASTANEAANNSLAKSQSELSDKTAKATATVQAIQTLHQQAMKDVNQFKNNSHNYKKVLVLTRDIVRELGELLKIAKDNPKSGIANSRILFSLTQEVYSNVSVFVRIASNGKANLSGSSQKNDGANLLEFKDRLLAVDEVVVNLDRILNTLVHMKNIFHYQYTYVGLLRDALPFENYMVTSTEIIANDIINNLGKLKD